MIRVIAQYPATADAVDAVPEELPDTQRFPSWHAWAWACGFVPFVVVSGYRVLAPTRDWPAPAWLIQVSGITLLATLVLALIRYHDDRARDTAKHDRTAIVEDSVGCVGTVTGASIVSGNTRGVDIEFEGPGGPTVAALPVPGAEVAGPRPGDPVAIWAARDRPVVLIRYHRGWADDLLAAVHGAGAVAGTATEPEAKSAEFEQGAPDESRTGEGDGESGGNDDSRGSEGAPRTMG